MVLNRDDPVVMGWRPEPQTVREGQRTRVVPGRDWVTFGSDVPVRSGDWGLETVNGMTWLVRALALDDTRRKGREAAAAESTYLQRLMPA
ncbi:hypothetical protein RZS08_58370, partial [Arthrospira platensis SPKY1]|nr:hypothetical protein [Arthrospira platensis SPKY1]